MLPPFPTVGPRADLPPLPFEERPVLRRGAPERLRLELPAPGWPPVLIRAESPAAGPGPAAGGWVRRLAGALRLATPA